MKGNILVVANWKNNTRLADAHILSLAIRNEVEHIEGVQVVICPPAVWLAEVKNIVHDQIHHLKVGLQDISSENPGPYTGEIAAELVSGVANYALIAHSETMRRHNYSLEQIQEKIHQSINNGIIPIICIGEDKQSSSSKYTLAKKLETYLRGVTTAKRARCVIAYEPVWAISDGWGKDKRPASAEYANEVAIQLKKVVPANTKILYGGSVNAKNVLSYVVQEEVAGVLVGGASLHLREFVTLVKNAAKGA